MSVALDVLLVEDSAADAELTLAALRQAGFRPNARIVATEAEYLTALDHAPEVIISDYGLPSFGGLQALALSKARAPEIPFILVSGTVGEDIAVRAMQLGASDYLLKDRMARLGAAVEQALERRRADADLRESEQRLRLVTENVPAMIAYIDKDLRCRFANSAMCELHGIPRERMLGMTLREIAGDAVYAQIRGALDAVREGRTMRLRYEHRLPGGDSRHIEVRRTPDRSADGTYRGYYAMLLDVTDTVRAEAMLAGQNRVLEMAVAGAPAEESIGHLLRLVEAQHAGALASFLVLDEDGRRLGHCAAPSLPEQYTTAIDGIQIGPSVGSCGTTAWRRQPVFVEDIAADPLWADYRTLALEHGLRACWSTPVFGPAGALLGTFALYYRTSSLPAPHHLRTIEVVTHTASVVLAHAQDVAQRTLAEERIRRLNRVHAVLSGINTLIVRAQDREALFDDACRVAVEQGGFALAWIGLLDKDAQVVRPVARAGRDEGYLDLQPFAAPGSSAAPGLLAAAMRTGAAVLSNDIERDASVLRRAEALKRGLRSAIALPLRQGGTAGVLILYSGIAGFFDEQERALLGELAGNISYAMAHLDARATADYLATHDAVSGLPSRNLLGDRIEQALRAAPRTGRSPAVACIDIERFRLVNDTLGRQAGDEVLRQVGARLRVALRAEDSVARLGADRFAAVLDGATQPGEAAALLNERVLPAFAAPLRVAGQELTLTLNAGIALGGADGASADALLANAETALRRARLSGERCLYYAPEMNLRVAQALTLERRLRRALERDELVLHYQPKLDARTRRLAGLEALMRWNDPESGLVPPGGFIPLMEETGLIVEAGRWAMRRAVADLMRWRALGLAVPRVAVNVSTLQLRKREFVDGVLAALAGFGDGERLLDLEITESAVMADVAGTAAKLQVLREHGVRVAIDDFGTGYSSLAYVARLPISSLKIDRAFVAQMQEDRHGHAIVASVIGLAHALRLGVVAEGVETEDQARALARMGCDELQGYLVGRPVPPADLEAGLLRG